MASTRKVTTARRKAREDKLKKVRSKKTRAKARKRARAGAINV